MFRTAVMVFAALSLVACGGDEKDSGFLENAQQTATDTATHPGSPGGTAVIPSTESGATVIVTLNDNSIAVADSDRIPPGPTVFTITNGGSGAHSLYIEGPGVSKAPDSATLAKGATSSVSVTLQPGTYTLYCPVLNHRDNGESVTLVIRPANAPAPTSKVVPTTTT